MKYIVQCLLLGFRVLKLIGAGFARWEDCLKSPYVEEWKGEYKYNEDHLFNLTLTSKRIMHGTMYIMEWFILASEVMPKQNNVPFCNGSDQWEWGKVGGHTLPACPEWTLQSCNWYMMSPARTEFEFFLRLMYWGALSWTWNVFYPMNRKNNGFVERGGKFRV